MSANAAYKPQAESEHPALPFNVMCIDDNVLLIDALEKRLKLEADFLGLYRVPNMDESVEYAVKYNPSIVLLDIDLPGLDAFTILTGLVRRVPAARVVVFTGYPSTSILVRAMSKGAWAFLSKGIGSEHLVNALRRVLAGEAVIELNDD